MKYIKKTFKILIVTLMLILMVSSTCMAGQDVSRLHSHQMIIITEDSRIPIRHMEQQTSLQMRRED